MTTADDTGYRYRAALPEDAPAIKALDSSFTTGTVFRVSVTDEGFLLREVPVEPPLTKVFPEDEPDGDEGEGEDGADSVPSSPRAPRGNWPGSSPRRTPVGTAG